MIIFPNISPVIDTMRYFSEFIYPILLVIVLYVVNFKVPEEIFFNVVRIIFGESLWISVYYGILMFEQRIFETDFHVALAEELTRRDMTVRQLAELTGIPPVTLYKISSGERDPRLSTVRKIVQVFSPHHGKFIALIAAKFLLDEVEGTKVDVGGVEYRIKGYTANSLDDCILAAVRARSEGAAGIICAPILASLIERLVDVPVAIMKPEMGAVFTAVDSITKRL